MQKHLQSLLAATVTAVACSLPAAASSEGWVDDFDKALALAKTQGKDLLVDFTGSDWCGWCIKLDKEVFDTELFRAEAPKHFVLVELDFPRGEEAKAKVPNPKRNNELKEKYGIQGFPSILLITNDEVKYGQTGYRPGGPEGYLEHLSEMRTKAHAAMKDAKVLRERFDASEGAVQRVQVMGEVLTKLEAYEPDHPGHAFLVPTARRAFTLDPENAHGLALRAAKSLLRGGESGAELIETAERLDPANANGALELAVKARVLVVRDDGAARAVCSAVQTMLDKNQFKDHPTAAFLLTNAAYWNQRFLNDLPKAKEFAGAALKFVGDDQRMKDMLDKIMNS